LFQYVLITNLIRNGSILYVMVRKGYAQLVLKEEDAKKIEQFIKGNEKYKDRTLSSAIKLILFEVMENDEYLRRYGPFLKWIGPHDNLLLLYDHFLGKTVEIEVHEKMMYCREDEESDCVHIGFCFAIPEVYKILGERGFKPPKVKAK